MSVFYERFERHGHGDGLKGQSTHYCPGCGHGLAHKYLAEAIQELGIQDRTVAVSPVGCSVFLYYYMDVGNTQAAHGRAPAVALGHKVANPESIVISYQGDGDLASIGLAEIIQATQTGLPLTFIFVNNAVYGMTGGQMAPTTLMEMTTTTTPHGRSRIAGLPLRVAETVAQLDGPVYVERVALFDNKQRTRAKKAIKKAIQLQVENRGLGFVEVLSECPTHLKMTPLEAEEWVKTEMTKVFPLGVKKDETVEPWFHLEHPTFDPERIIAAIGGTDEHPKRFGTGFPAHIDPRDIALKFAGAGGDGAQTIAKLTTEAAINEGFDSTYIPSYGPESRGGTSYADVHVAVEEVLSPASPNPHVLLVFNGPSLEKFGPTVQPGGIIVYDRSVISSVPALDPSITVTGVPITGVSVELGNMKVKNVVAWGALQAATGLFPPDSFLTALRHALGAGEGDFRDPGKRDADGLEEGHGAESAGGFGVHGAAEGDPHAPLGQDAHGLVQDVAHDDLEGQGHACLTVEDLLHDADALLGWPAAAQAPLRALMSTLPARGADWLQALRASPLVAVAGTAEQSSPATGTPPLVLHGQRLYLRRYWRHEQAVAAGLRQRLVTTKAVDEAAARHWLDALFPAAGSAGPDWQKLACALALRSGLMLVTGGPGTGKTFTAARLLALLSAVDPAPQRMRVALAAPTGKAAARLKQAMADALAGLPPALAGAPPLRDLAARLGPAHTLHRLLGARPETRRFRHDAAHPLPLDVLIVDEASMVHLEMMAALLQALPPQARLVLLGDKDQLASVEAGAVLGDLCHGTEAGRYGPATAAFALAVAGQVLPAAFVTGGPPLAQQTVMLRHSHRFGGPISELAAAVNQGDAARAAALLKEAPSETLHWLEAPSAAAVVRLAVDGRTGAEGGYAAYLQAMRQRPEPGELPDAAAFQDWVLRVWRDHGRQEPRPAFRVVFLTRGVNRANHMLWLARQCARNKDRRLVYAATQDAYLGTPCAVTDPLLNDHHGHWRALCDAQPSSAFRREPVRLSPPLARASMF